MGGRGRALDNVFVERPRRTAESGEVDVQEDEIAAEPVWRLPSSFRFDGEFSRGCAGTVPGLRPARLPFVLALRGPGLRIASRGLPYKL